MSALSLDLMELADIGGQPRKLANEIHRQIRLSGDLTLPVPLKDVAAALGIDEIVEHPTTTFEGMLLASPDRSRGKIIIREGVSRGRFNFTLGHEIGHFVNPYHKPPPDGFVCESRGMRAKRNDGTSWSERPLFERMEIEANEFSITLLVPAPEYKAARARLTGCDLLHVEPLSKLFATSKEVMARIYVDTSPDKIAILTSHDGQIRNFFLPAKFPYLGLAKSHPLPPKSHSATFLKFAKAGQSFGLTNVSADAWLDHSPRNVELFEQTLAQRDGWAMTLLLVEEPDEDEQSEDEEIERRWSGPRFAYGR